MRTRCTKATCGGSGARRRQARHPGGSELRSTVGEVRLRAARRRARERCVCARGGRCARSASPGRARRRRVRCGARVTACMGEGYRRASAAGRSRPRRRPAPAGPRPRRAPAQRGLDERTRACGGRRRRLVYVRRSRAACLERSCGPPGREWVSGTRPTRRRARRSRTAILSMLSAPRRQSHVFAPKTRPQPPALAVRTHTNAAVGHTRTRSARRRPRGGEPASHWRALAARSFPDRMGTPYSRWAATARRAPRRRSRHGSRIDSVPSAPPSRTRPCSIAAAAGAGPHRLGALRVIT